MSRDRSPPRRMPLEWNFMAPSDKLRSISLLIVAEVAVMSLWFVSAATLPEMLREVTLSPVRQAAMSSGVQIGFVAGGFASAAAGHVADRLGKAETTIVAMALSGTSAVAVALTFGGPVWLTFVIVVIWGITIIPDSAQFSALVADASPPDRAGTLLSFQTALGFALTFGTVQVTPYFATTFGWPIVLAGLALGPAFGIVAMARLRSMGPAD
jgi:MFS family permease